MIQIIKNFFNKKVNASDLNNYRRSCNAHYDDVCMQVTMKPVELYTQLATQTPRRQKRIQTLESGQVGDIDAPELTKEQLQDILAFGAQMLPGAEIAREIGASKLEPTISEDIQEGKVSDAILKGIGTASDVALAGSPFLGPEIVTGKHLCSKS